MPVYRDDLPSVSVSRLRATAVITAETTSYRVQLGRVEQNVGIYLQKFLNGGSWSFFACPMCGRRARTLRLHGDDIICRGCCERRGIWPRIRTLSPRRRAEASIKRLRAKLESETSLRLKPVLWGKMERRSRHEAALKRAEYVVWRKLARENPDGE